MRLGTNTNTNSVKLNKCQGYKCSQLTIHKCLIDLRHAFSKRCSKSHSNLWNPGLSVKFKGQLYNRSISLWNRYYHHSYVLKNCNEILIISLRIIKLGVQLWHHRCNILRCNYLFKRQCRQLFTNTLRKQKTFQRFK